MDQLLGRKGVGTTWPRCISEDSFNLLAQACLVSVGERSLGFGCGPAGAPGADGCASTAEPTRQDIILLAAGRRQDDLGSAGTAC